MFGDEKEVGTLYYLAGSQVFETIENITESLAGRVGIIDLYPLSTREIYNLKEEPFIPNINILRKKETLKYEYLGNIFKRIFRGSYPELYKNKEISLEAFYYCFSFTTTYE